MTFNSGALNYNSVFSSPYPCCSCYLVESIGRRFHFLEVCFQIFGHQMLIYSLMLLSFCVACDESSHYIEKSVQRNPKWEQRLVYHKLQIEVSYLKHIITWNSSAQVLCSSSPKPIFVLLILATPFAKVSIWLCDWLTKVHDNNKSKIIKFPQKLNMIL